MKTPAAIILILTLICLDALAQDWPTWGGPPGGSKYSALTQINKDNVTDLEVAWTYRTEIGRAHV
jgi:quinoprotein glucose dehydrogenase